MEDLLVRLIGDVGFPIAIASFVILRLNGKVGKLADAMKDLAEALREHNRQSEGIERRLEHLEYQDHVTKTGGC